MANAATKTYPLTDKGDKGKQYIARPLLGFENDVEGLRELAGMGVHVLLEGDPGCGKSALVRAAFPHAENQMGHSKLTAPDMLWVPRMGPGGEIIMDPAPLVRAIQKNVMFNMEEITRASEDSLTPLFSAMDGSPAIIGGGLDGSDLPIPDGFHVVASCNPNVRGAFLPEAIRSRFMILTVQTSEDLLIKMGIDERIITSWNNLGTQTGEVWQPSIREMERATEFLKAGNDAMAYFALTGTRVPVRDRERVSEVISGIIGVRPTAGGMGGVIQ